MNSSEEAKAEQLELELAPHERTECETWTRVMGYHRPVESFNKGKKEEFYERKCFKEAKAVEHLEEGLADDIA